MSARNNVFCRWWTATLPLAISEEQSRWSSAASTDSVSLEIRFFKWVFTKRNAANEDNTFATHFVISSISILSMSRGR